MPAGVQRGDHAGPHTGLWAGGDSPALTREAETIRMRVRTRDDRRARTWKEIAR